MISHSRRASRQPETGDIVVTTVAHHYNIGREEADGERPIVAIAVKDRLADALALARRVITGRQRVFLFDDAGSRHCVEIDYAKS